MPTTEDRPPPGGGPPADDPDGLTAAEAAHLAARETVPIDLGPRGDADPANRETVRLSTGRPGGRRPGRAPLPVAAGFASLWAALLSYLPVAVVMALAQAAEDTGSIAGAARTGLAGWLLGHGVPLGTSIGPLGLAPLALAAWAAWRLVRAGVHVTRATGVGQGGSWRGALAAAAAVGAGYGLLGALAAVVVDGPGLRVSPLRAGLTLAGFGLAAALVGALRRSGALWAVAGRMPAVLRHGMRTGVVAALLVLAAGAGGAGLSLAMGGAEAAETIGAYRTGVAGQAGITLISVAYAPNAAVWSAAYLLGPGFALGTDTTVRLTEVTVGALPAVPILAGLPEGPVGGPGAALLAVPALTALVAGWLLARRLPAAPRRTVGQRGEQRDGGAPPGGSAGSRGGTAFGAALLAGPVAGALLGLLAELSAGPLGGGRLVQFGPVGWQVAAVGAAVTAVGALLGLAAGRSWRRAR